MMTRRDLYRMLALIPASAFAQTIPALSPVTFPESYRIYNDAPRLLLTAARVRLLRRERERRSLRWDQFETLWGADSQFPEFGWTAALRYQIAEDDSAGHQAVTWAAGAATDIRQIALVADWCAKLMSAGERTAIYAKLQRAMAMPVSPSMALADARNKTFAAVVLAEARPAESEKALREVCETFWNAGFIPAIRSGKRRVPNAEANALFELMHAIRDNLNFDLRETFPKWFRDYPLIHVLAHYPEPFPAPENDFRIPADRNIDERGPDVSTATLSRAAELAMVAFDSNAPETQLVQGFCMNDKYLMRGTLGIAYEFLWANPYQPGLSYYHVPLVAHDVVAGEVWVRSDWEDDADWLGYFDGRLQLFADGKVSNIAPDIVHDPIDVQEATVFFARGSSKFQVPQRKAADNSTDEDPVDDVFVIGLQPKRRYHVEVDNEGMFEATSDVGGIIYTPGLPQGAAVRFEPAPET